MKTRLLVLFALCMTISFHSCNKEDSLLHQEEDATVVEPQDDSYADLPESVRSLISSLVISTRAYPPNVDGISLTPTGAIHPDGETRSVVATGSFTTTLHVKAQDLSSGMDLATGIINGTGSVGVTTLTIPPYHASSGTPARVVGFFYLGNTSEWELFRYEIQNPNGNGSGGGGDDHVVLSTGRFVAHWDAGQFDWAAALGINGNYNHQYFYNSGYSDGTRDNFTYTAVEKTGCNAYQEAGYPAGEWKVPTWAELKEISERQNELSGFVNTAPYWSSTESETATGNGANYVYIVNKWYYERGNKYLTNTFHVRCVHP